VAVCRRQTGGVVVVHPDFNPNSALEYIRAAVGELLPVLEAGEQPSFATVEILEFYTRNLDEWLSKGGYPPDAWSPLSKLPEHVTVTGRVSIRPPATPAQHLSGKD
jgi:hypothetical protein